MIPDRVGIFGLSLGSLVTMHIAAESSVVKASDRWLILVAKSHRCRILRPVRSASICFTCHRVACVVFQPRCCICVSGSHFYPRDRTIMEVIMEPKS